ncbi:MAG: chemotaxis protein CheA [bacterium]|nr:chemotaxis protein CheA [bacterium]
MKEIIEDFLVEADELIASLDTNLVTLETAPDDLDLLNEIFRAAHTVKGTSSFLGFEQVTDLTHKMEDILNKLRKSELKVTPRIMDLLLESVDILKVLLDNVREQNGEEVNLDDIVARLIACQDDNAAVAEAVSEPSQADRADEPTTEAETDSAPPAAEETAAPPVSSAPPTEKKVVHKKSTEQTIRVDVGRLDSLMLLMGELVLARNSLVQTVSRINKHEETGDSAEALNGTVASVNYITSELQLAVMKMRMQPVGKVFGKFPRLVRDLARDSKKQIQLEISGESTELDKSVIEEIGDPLVHLIRNSCDHGVESPAEREAKGKPAKGVVKLSAGQEGSNIIIAIQDDGKGLDVDAIRAKAVERGLATEADVERLPDREVFRFIFEAGFSTAKKVTDVSGRGVGMDVVRTNIEKLNGLIELESTVDIGTTITIKLPLTLAILQGLLVESDEDVFILPLSSVHETVKTEQSDVSYLNQRPVLRLRDEIIPIINLGELLKGNEQGFVLTEKPYVVVVGLADRKLGIIIDRFLGQEEVVIKSLGQYLGATEGIAGATILGDGRIRLIVDLLGLFSIARRLS